MVRVSDSLLPQIAADLGVSVGAASIVVTAYALAHGSVQLIIGPIGDRFGKYACVAVAAGMSTVLVLLCGLARSLPLLVAARLGCGPGHRLDHSAGDGLRRRRHPLRAPPAGARHVSCPGRSSASCSARPPAACSAIYFGWRNVFFILAALCSRSRPSHCSIEFFRNPITHAGHATRNALARLRRPTMPPCCARPGRAP